MSAHVHTAGIIPLSNLQSDINSPVPQPLLPVSNGFCAIQKSVFECALAGCNTIWIVANNDLAPIVRQVVGEWVYDPVYYERTYTKFYKDHRREIPIYYVPIHPKDRARRDSYGWSVLYGVYSAWYAAYKISQWILPEKYYVSFPMSAYDIYEIRQHRNLISDPRKNFFLCHGNKTVKDNQYLPFTMTGEDFKKCRNHINQKTTREYLPPSPDQQYPTHKRPLQERWSARYFQNSEVFQPLNLEDAHVVETPWYHDLSTWEGYRNYMGSENIIKTPQKELTLPHKHVKIPYST